MTRTQNTVDWFLQRIGRFTSTSLHSVINVRNSLYFHNTNIKIIHSQCKNSMVPTPHTDITFDDNSESNNIDDDVDNLYQTVIRDTTIDKSNRNLPTRP